MICERCHAGQMLGYERLVGRAGSAAIINGLQCERCAYTQLSNDEEFWSAVGL